MDEFAILLEASEPSLNRRRFWRVRMARDLFGAWRAYVSFGRIGRPGRIIRHDFGSREEARAFIEAALKRRRGARKRCGVAYRLIEVASGPDGPAEDDIIALISARQTRAGPRRDNPTSDQRMIP